MPHNYSAGWPGTTGSRSRASLASTSALRNELLMHPAGSAHGRYPRTHNLITEAALMQNKSQPFPTFLSGYSRHCARRLATPSQRAQSASNKIFPVWAGRFIFIHTRRIDCQIGSNGVHPCNRYNRYRGYGNLFALRLTDIGHSGTTIYILVGAAAGSLSDANRLLVRVIELHDESTKNPP